MWTIMEKLTEERRACADSDEKVGKAAANVITGEEKNV